MSFGTLLFLQMRLHEIHTCAGMTAFVDEMGFLPLLRLGVEGWSAEDAADEEAQYARLPEGGWEWPLWLWKGDILRASGCAYGKFFARKAGFISRAWWPDFCNWRRSCFPLPEEDSVERMILRTLEENGRMLTRELRAACGFPGKMRGQFDTYVARLEMGCRVVTEDFVYPQDRCGKDYGWGRALLTTPEILFGKDACRLERTPQDSRLRIEQHLQSILPDSSEEAYRILLKPSRKK